MRTRLRESEAIVMVTKKHPLDIILVVALTIIFVVLFFIFLGNTGSPSWVRWTFGVGSLVLLLVVAIMFWNRQRDIWVVTNQRVVDERGIISLYSMESPLDKITNVSLSQSLLGRILGYGLVQIQTAGEVGVTEEAKIMRPREFRQTIFEEREAYLEHMSGHARPEPAEAQLVPGVTKECPFCAEIIKAKAKICRFCNRELPADEPVQPSAAGDR